MFWVAHYDHGEGLVRLFASPLEDSMKSVIRQFIRDEQGQDLIEYGLLVGVVTAVSAATVSAIGTKVGTWFDALKTAIGA